MFRNYAPMPRTPKQDSTFMRRCRVLLLGGIALGLLGSISANASETFIKPTPEELSMTSLPGYPGAPAVILYKEEITKDDLHSMQSYYRIKILTEEGKKYANVELGYVSSSGWEVGVADDKTLEDISGRTIHPDGTIIPFTGKPYLKVLEKAGGIKVQEKVFTLPDVEVGSIIEYRYATRINDYVFEPPTWLIQDDLYVKQAHFVWWPTAHRMVDEDEKEITTISWFPILPDGAKIENHEMVGGGQNGIPLRTYELSVKDVPPRIKEEYMPPISSFSYRVRFSFTPYRTQQEYWTAVGKHWSKTVNNFASANDALRDATNKAVAGAITPEDKLHKIYATVMTLENTRFTRERDKREDAVAGARKVSNASDVLALGRGTPKELTYLFIAMARVAGFQAYAMYVPDRSEEIFTPYWMSMQQFDDVIAVVNLDGKERFFDPGSRYCPFGQLAWQHTLVQGLRQTDSGTSFANTVGDAYKINHTSRVANLTMGADGQITGKVNLIFTGAPAVGWRQTALRGDSEGLRKELRESAEAMLPKTLEVDVDQIKNVDDYEKPLEVVYKVKGTIGNSIGKRMLVPGDVFLANESATFPHDKRESAVYFHYPQYLQDAVRVNFPSGLSVEAVPTSAKYSISNFGLYGIQYETTPTSVTSRRDFAFAEVIILPQDYGNLRSFYSQLESKDQESIVLKAAPIQSAGSTAGPGN